MDYVTSIFVAIILSYLSQSGIDSPNTANIKAIIAITITHTMFCTIPCNISVQNDGLLSFGQVSVIVALTVLSRPLLYGQYILGKPANGLGNRAIYQPAAS